MTDKKFTDEKIIKGLTELSLYTGFQEKHIQVLNASIDLINRQKSEIERLQNILLRFMDETGKAKMVDDIDHIAIIPIMTELNEQYRKDIKAEAYKEFAERLKKKGRYATYCGNFVDMFSIDHILKELVRNND